MTRYDNLAKYESSQVVDFYKRQSQLQDCEKPLFDRYLRPGMAILDIGVGGGRTTPYLSAIAGRYVGVDYSQAMVAVCKGKWPDFDFRVCDATDMSQFCSGEFDAVVFSFNGIDEIADDKGRAHCLCEVSRVLKRGGVFIFSSHNAKVLGIWPNFTGAAFHQKVWRTMRAVFKSFMIMRLHLVSGVFAAGHGYINDSVHGGLYRYASTPSFLRPQIERVGLELIDILGYSDSVERPLYFVPWFYYACRKLGETRPS